MEIQFSEHASQRMKQRFGIKVPSHYKLKPKSYRQSAHFMLSNNEPAFSIVMDVKDKTAVMVVSKGWVLTVLGPERSPSYDAAIWSSKKIK